MDQVKFLASRLIANIEEALGNSPEISPVLCFANDNFQGDPAIADGVLLCNAKDLVSVLVAHSEVSGDTVLESEAVAIKGIFKSKNELKLWTR